MHLASRVGEAGALVIACSAAQAQPCTPHWESLPSVPNSAVWSLCAITDANGPALYAGGGFADIGPTAASRIGMWDGTQWTALGTGITRGYGISPCCPYVFSIQPYAGNVYVGGSFRLAGGLAARSIARWTGSEWQVLGSGLTLLNCADCGPIVWDMTEHGESLYIGGEFTLAGGLQASNIARWDGQAWFTLDTGVGPGSSWEFPFGVRVSCVESFQGSLYIAGYFGRAGQVETEAIARWDGSQWWPVGSGLAPAGTATTAWVDAMAVFDDGQGPMLYIAGNFAVPGTSVQHMARWDGASWSAVGSGPPPFAPIVTMTAFDDGSGPALFVGGGNEQTEHVAKWDGNTWSPLGTTGNTVYALAAFEHGGRPTLHAAGWFRPAGASEQQSLARWVGCPCYANCDQSALPPVLGGNDFVCFLNSFVAGESYANCDGSTPNPVLTAADFICFLNRFASGCQ